MTTSATGDRSRPGFTLLEILLALALIAVLSAVTIGVSSNLLSAKAATSEEIFWKAAEAARRAAVNSGRETDMSFDDKLKAFAVQDGVTSKSFPVPRADPDLGVDFLSSKAGGGSSILVGGTLLETGALPHVSFFSDGTCSPFRVQFRSKGAAHVISIDPWTCAQTLVQGGGT